MHRFAKRLFVLAMVIHIVPCAAFADWLIDGVPIPDDAKVVPPSATVPENQQRFLGAWVGRWGGALKHILIVESLQPDGSASVIYGWGDSPGLNITRGFSRLGANLSGDTLAVRSSFITATYKLTSATSATASYRRGESRAQADMVKLDFAALIASSKIFAGSDPESIMISTKLRENGKPVRLEVVIISRRVTGRSRCWWSITVPPAWETTRRFSLKPFSIPRSPRCSSRRATWSPSRNGVAAASRRGSTTKDSMSTAVKVTPATRSCPCQAPTAR